MQYDDERGTAVAAAVSFGRWRAADPVEEWTVPLEGLAPYVPGRFFERELPCLLALLAGRPEPDVVVVDGHVWLGLDRRPGLGWHLWDAVDGRFAVVGVAKRPFRGGGAVEVCRGDSATPLHVTAIGIDEARAASGVMAMHGAYRVPTLLRRVDRLCRGLVDDP